jgi:hypothetical protein
MRVKRNDNRQQMVGRRNIRQAFKNQLMTKMYTVKGANRYYRPTSLGYA